MQIKKPVMPLGSNFNWIWHFSFQEQIIETMNEINIPWMNSLFCEWSKRKNGLTVAPALLAHFFCHKDVTSKKITLFHAQNAPITPIGRFWIFDGKANYNQFYEIFLRHNDTTWKRWSNFFSLQSISILTIRSLNDLLIVSILENSHF